MDVALQRPIIVTSSINDKTIRVWNYLTGHCEYCKIILTEKDEAEKELDILSVAIHPNGYYIAVSDSEMIRFFHLCYRELRYYNNDSVKNENTKKNCTILKFSNGGHLVAALSNKSLFIIKSYTRETLREFKTSHTGIIKSIVWDENDYYVYTVGNDGVIIEYNLFNFKVEEIATKYVSYTGATMFTLDKKNPNTNLNYNAIMACGVSQNKNVLSQIFKLDAEKSSETPDVFIQT